MMGGEPSLLAAALPGARRPVAILSKGYRALLAQHFGVEDRTSWIRAIVRGTP